MRRPPLLLEQTLYDHVSVDAQRDYVPENDEGRDSTLRVDVRTARLKDSSDMWNVVVEVTVDRVDDEPVPPYVIRLRCWSVFQVDSAEDDDQAARLALVTGGSMIFSGMREYVALLTSRGPWGAFMLPTITLNDAELVPVEPPPEIGHSPAAELDPHRSDSDPGQQSGPGTSRSRSREKSSRGKSKA